MYFCEVKFFHMFKMGNNRVHISGTGSRRNMGPSQMKSSHHAKNFDGCGDLIGGGFSTEVVPLTQLPAYTHHII
jgi:hypothetical protein